MADDDPACRQQVLDHPQAERKAEIEPDRLLDDVGREPVAATNGFRCRHHHAQIADVRRQVVNLTAPAHCHRIPKARYRVENWPEYHRGLVRRGDIRVWLSEDAIAGWPAACRRTPGGQRRFSNLAIETTLMLGAVLHLPLRQSEGFVRADSDEAGHGFRFEPGHMFRPEVGQDSDLMSATLLP
jgi:hypothetical protein